MHNTLAMMTDAREPVAVLWRLAWDDSVLACSLYRDARGFEMRVESNGIIVTEEARLLPGDICSISVSGIGTLSNPAAIVE